MMCSHVGLAFGTFRGRAVFQPTGEWSSIRTASIVGDWHGQTQFQGAQDAVVIEEAHSLVPLVLTFSADGKVSGAGADNGCTLLGLWAPGGTPRLFVLDITRTTDGEASRHEQRGQTGE